MIQNDKEHVHNYEARTKGKAEEKEQKYIRPRKMRETKVESGLRSIKDTASVVSERV